jgi:hypothetical protein
MIHATQRFREEINFLLQPSRINFSFSFHEFADSRVKNYAFVDTPLPTIALCLIYLAWVMVIGPYYMRDKKPYSLRNTLIYYNAFQVFLSAYMFYEVRN